MCTSSQEWRGNFRDGAHRHAPLHVLAMKSWLRLALARHSEAEEELRGMVGNKDIPKVVWIHTLNW